MSLMNGASLGNDLDKELTKAGEFAHRMPFQVDSTLRRAINAGTVMFIGQHLSETVEQLLNLQLTRPATEAASITEDGHIIAHLCVN
jgi:succinyl-CoA:acetate CoA-transferase